MKRRVRNRRWIIMQKWAQKNEELKKTKWGRANENENRMKNVNSSLRIHSAGTQCTAAWMCPEYHRTAASLFVGEDELHKRWKLEGLAGVAEMQQHPLEVKRKHWHCVWEVIFMPDCHSIYIFSLYILSCVEQLLHFWKGLKEYSGVNLIHV